MDLSSVKNKFEFILNQLKRDAIASSDTLIFLLWESKIDKKTFYTLYIFAHYQYDIGAGEEASTGQSQL